MSLAEWWPWALFVALGATALVALLYRRTDLRPGWKALFVILRGISVTLTALLFADLACQVQRPGESPAAAIVVDDSASMSLTDAEGRTRAGCAEELAVALRAAHPELDWSVYRLGELSAADPLEAVEMLASRRPDLAAVVVVGDGGGRVPVASLDIPFTVHAVVAGGASRFDVALDAPRGPRLALTGKSALFQVDVRLVGEGPTEATVRASGREVFGGRREVELDPALVDLSDGATVANRSRSRPTPFSSWTFSPRGSCSRKFHGASPRGGGWGFSSDGRGWSLPPATPSASSSPSRATRAT
ncbi:MAG: hypothetical protein A2Y64_06855 [Candidatus Coatesbacteria bacterium RBG_13_66_14]|uniref:Aerotolerance regulator N-terminal domain-containing protein n=1 Tax=Candidatus Coatesbacteria bacterium RBG_13_66_14 TaxID=1817816 RepID=A0A1F5EY46_9BACT|nr:MAG: hypothetical protein A2Y64_06855 [Candidatus Coatesbacteria bacterium RBG_13_66_14]